MDMRVYVLTNREKAEFHRFCASLSGRDVLIASYSDVEKELTANVSNILDFHMEYHPNSIALICSEKVEFGTIDLFEDRTREAFSRGAGIVSPLLLDRPGGDKVLMAGTSGGFPRGAFRSGSLRSFRLDTHEPHLWLPFICVAVNPDMVREIGLPDRRLKCCFSDRDFCVRARQAGWMVLLDRLSVAAFHGCTMSHEAGDECFQAEQALFHRKWGGAVLEELQCGAGECEKGGLHEDCR